MNRTKAEWRRALLAARIAIPEGLRCERSAAMLEHVRRLSCFEGARTVLGYVALGAEADPASLLVSTVASGVSVFVPFPGDLDEGPLWTMWEGVSSSSNPTGLSAHALSYPILAVIPGVGFDVHGVRLGRGGGFYDRALADLRRWGPVHAVGLAFECQIVAELPSEAWDQGVDFVVSENRIIKASADLGSQGEAGSRWS